MEGGTYSFTHPSLPASDGGRTGPQKQELQDGLAYYPDIQDIDEGGGTTYTESFLSLV